MRVCIAYDCLYPLTIGGAERWYRTLATELAAAGHAVTYLTRRQWPAGEPLPEHAAMPGVRVLAVSRADALYDASGRRAIGPPLRFGRGVLGHLLRHRDSYDALHLCSFPYFSLLAARAALAGARVRIAVDWFEVWSPGYWREYLGPVGGRVGRLVQRACALATPTAFVFSEVHAQRLRREGLRGEPIRLSGLYAGPLERAPVLAAPARPVAVFAGRHIPEKRVELIPAVVAAARSGPLPDLRAVVLGDGPERERLLAAIAAAEVGDAVAAPGFVDPARVDAELGGATCMLLPSAREGYGLVVLEAAARGTPSVVIAGPDNAAVELVEEGVNGFLAPSAEPAAVAAAVARAHAGGRALRESTAEWFARNAPRLTARGSVDRIMSFYEGARG